LTVLPPKLNPGDAIGIVAPASPMIPERLAHGIRYLQKRGFQIKLGEHIHDLHGYLAGCDEDRVGDLNQMFLDDEVAAIFCTRGGYGVPRILPAVDYEAIRRRPKILVGYSDITALQLAIFKNTGLVTFSGPMVAVEMATAIPSFTEAHFWKMLSEPRAGFQMRVKSASGFCLRPGKAKGRLLGGCLSLICSLLGTPFLPDFRGAILFLEDIGEEPYRIDRMLTQLKLAGILNQVNGIVFGQFPECVPKSSGPSLNLSEVIAEVTADLPIPILVDFPYGHIDEKYTLPIGIEAVLEAEAGVLEIVEPAVLG
jgi:muramoyltetrapeptide carboxypeptidase